MPPAWHTSDAGGVLDVLVRRDLGMSRILRGATRQPAESLAFNA